MPPPSADGVREPRSPRGLRLAGGPLPTEGEGPGCATSGPSDPTWALQNEAPLLSENLTFPTSGLLVFIFPTVLMMENVKSTQSRGGARARVLLLPIHTAVSSAARITACPMPISSTKFAPLSFCLFIVFKSNSKGHKLRSVERRLTPLLIEGVPPSFVFPVPYTCGDTGSLIL